LIFVTAGTALPFDRLIRAMDGWAGQNPDEDVYAQVGDGSYEPRHMRWVRQLRRVEYGEAMEAAELIVAHAGVGSVVTASEYGRPILLLPRRAKLGEHRNDHQLDTIARLGNRHGIGVAQSEADLPGLIAEMRKAGNGRIEPLGKTAPADFLSRIRGFVDR
jgi:UDP-N-acetylglucosamine transferase subunit ALG13